MKNQKSKYILLVLVVIVWSMIIARSFSLSRNGGAIINLDENVGHKTLKEEIPLSYDLYLNYTDPFLEGEDELLTSKDEIFSENSEADSKSVVSDDSLKIKLPSIIYSGLLSNLSNSEKIGFLVCERKEYMVKVGDSIDGLHIIALSNDFVKIAYQDHIIEIKKDKRDR